MDEYNDLVLDDGSVISEVLDRLRNGAIKKFRTEGTYNEFKLIVSVAFPPMVNAKHWKRNKGVLGVKDLLTISDEALALIVLENNYEEWIDIAKGKEIDKRKRKTKYTHGGQRRDGTKKGWSLEGRKRFNSIFQYIKVEREQAISKDRESKLTVEWAPQPNSDADKTNCDEEEGDKEEDFVPMTEFDFV